MLDKIEDLPLENIETEIINEPPLAPESDFHSILVEKLSNNSVIKFNECSPDIVHEEPKSVFSL